MHENVVKLFQLIDYRYTTISSEILLGRIYLTDRASVVGRFESGWPGRRDAGGWRTAVDEGRDVCGGRSVTQPAPGVEPCRSSDVFARDRIDGIKSAAGWVEIC